MPENRIVRNSGNNSPATDTYEAFIKVNSTTDVLQYNSNSTEFYTLNTTSAQTLANKTLTAPSITDLTEVVAATNVLLASESGKVCFLAHATEFVSTLPAVAAGLKFTFIVGLAPSGADYTVVAASGTPIHGIVLSKDLNGATDSGATAGTGVLTLTFVGGKAQKGDRADFVCDGTDWYVVASTGGAFDAITLS